MKNDDRIELDHQTLRVRPSRRWIDIPLAKVAGIELKRSWPAVVGDLLSAVGMLILLISLAGQYAFLHPDAKGFAILAVLASLAILCNAIRAFLINWVLLVSTPERTYEVGANADRTHSKAMALKDRLLLAVHRAS